MLDDGRTGMARTGKVSDMFVLIYLNMNQNTHLDFSVSSSSSRVVIGLKYFGMTNKRQDIVHIIRPDQGFTLLDTMCVYGNSHIATHGAFGVITFGFGTA